ncbi:MAG: spore maturation protein A [Firmicutes bacterium]|nr:spore maturation protein A [Bacillota bacterium]
MVMAYIWTGMVLTAVLFSFWSGTGAALSQAVLEGAQSGVTLTLSMAGAVCLWSGVERVMECAGLNRILARGLEPVIGRLFPSARKDPKVGELVSANVCANLLGLGNAATPMGIAATQRMSRYAKPGEASHEMCRLIVMNTASIQLIPTNVAAVRAGLGSAAPFDILPAVWVTSLCSVTVGLLAAFLFQRVSKND